jgi:hypothetical protein
MLLGVILRNLILANITALWPYDVEAMLAQLNPLYYEILE